MLPPKKEHPAEKTKLHTRNKHRERYNFKELIEICPELAPFVVLNVYNDESIDFFNPTAVRTLNKALLKRYYTIQYWDIPENYLCPPIPGRADYIHHAADLLGSNNFGKVPSGNNIKCLDIGVGANCVYPIIGNHEYGWSFVGTDIDDTALNTASQIISNNTSLLGNVGLRKQNDKSSIFKNILKDNELFDISICNPPFHRSFKESQEQSIRKLSNLKKEKITNPVLNFGGQSNELWCEGGEEEFALKMVYESWQYKKSCYWYTTLIAKQTHLKSLYIELDAAKAQEVKTITMGQGNKTSRIVAWTFLNQEERKQWRESRWNKS